MKQMILFILVLFFLIPSISISQSNPKKIQPPVTGDEVIKNSGSYVLNIIPGTVSNHFPGIKTNSGTVLFSPTGVHTIYDLQSNAVPQTIWQDPLNPSNVHAVFMQSLQTGFSERYTIYLFSEDYGATWSNFGSVPFMIRSGFPSIDGFTNGAAVIANHNVEGGGTQRTKIYYDLGPGFGAFTMLDPGIALGLDAIWPKLVCIPGNKISFVAAQNPGVPLTNSLINLNPAPGVFSGYQEYAGDIADAYSLARAANGLIGHAYIGDDNFPNNAYYRSSSDNGLTWSSPVTIWQWNAADSLGVLRGIDMVFNNNIPYVVFSLCKLYDFNFYPELPSLIKIWSPNINGGIPKTIADSSVVPFYPNKGNTSDFTPLCKPSVGNSSSGNFLAVAFNATTGQYSTSDSSSYYSGWICYSPNSGESWFPPEKITPVNPLRDWRYISVSKSNNLSENQLTVQMVCQADTVAGSFVSGGSPQGDAELIGIRFIISASALPSAPQLVSPANGSVNILLTPVLDWNIVSNAAAYGIQLSRNISFTDLIFNQSEITSTQFQVPASLLSYDSVYFWRVNAENSHGTSPWSEVWSFHTVTFLPPAPVLVSPANNSTDISPQPVLDWNEVSSALDYSVQLSGDTGFATLIINQVNLTSSNYVIPPSLLMLNTTYYWRVKAVNSNGESAWSSVWRFTTISFPLVPVLLSPSNGSTGISLTPVLDWNDVSNAQSYLLQLSADSNFTLNIIDQMTLVSGFSISAALSFNTKYFWRVKSVNSGGISDWSAVWNFTTLQLLAPTAPLLVSPLNASVNIPLNPLLDWNNVATANSYRVQIGLDLNFVLLILDSNINVSQLNVPSSLLSYNSLYFWRINASNSAGSGPWSSVWYFRTRLPTGISVISELIPEKFNLYNNYPNPFNPSTKIRFDIPVQSLVKISIYDFTGRKILNLLEEQIPAGSYESEFKADNLSSGVYFYRIEAGSFIQTGRMILLK